MPTYRGLKYKKYSTKEKLAIVRRYLNNHANMPEMEQKTGISNGQINNWVRRYQQEGPKGLESKKRCNPHAAYTPVNH
jgi:transposase-like protein